MYMLQSFIDSGSSEKKILPEFFNSEEDNSFVESIFFFNSFILLNLYQSQPFYIFLKIQRKVVIQHNQVQLHKYLYYFFHL